MITIRKNHINFQCTILVIDIVKQKAQEETPLVLNVRYLANNRFLLILFVVAYNLAL